MPQKKYTVEDKVLRKKIKLFLILIGVLSLFLFSPPKIWATTTPVNPTPEADEKNLFNDVTGSSPQIPSIKTLKFSTAVRLDDDFDHIFMKLAGATAFAEAYYAGNTQTLGILPGASGGAFGSFVPLFPVSGSKGLLVDTPSASISLPDGTLFRFALDTTPLNAAKYSSNPTDNFDLFDHMVTFYDVIADAYWIAWEDQPDGGDGDYDDLVVKVTGVVNQTAIPELPTQVIFPLFFLLSFIVFRIRNRVVTA